MNRTISRLARLSCLWVLLSVSRGAEVASGGAKPDEADFTELTIEQLGAIKVPTVVGASKHEQKTTEAPSAVTIITREDIQEYGYHTLGDLLRSVRGFYVTYDRGYNFTGLRGVNRPGDFGGRVLINVDGHRLNEPIYDSAFTDTEFLVDMDLVDRVEVIRGPGSSLYGNNAFFGVINVITRQGRDIQGAEASATVASYDTYSGRLTYGNKFKSGAEVLLSGTFFDSEGQDFYFKEYSAINNGVARGSDGSTSRSGFLTISYNDFKLYGGLVDRRKDIPTAQYLTVFNDNRFRDVDTRGFAELSYQHTFAGDWSLQARAYYDYYRFRGRYPFDYSVPPSGIITLNYDDDRSQFAGTEVILSKSFWDERNRITIGSEFREDLQLSLLNYDANPDASYLDVDRTATSYAFYLQDELRVLTNLVLNGGFRYDNFSTFGDTVNPRGALIYSPWTAGTWKFVYGEAFRAPNAYELSYATPVFKANPNLGPETIRSYELIYEQGLPGNLRTTASLFLNQIHGLIGQKLDPADGKNFFDNIDEVESKGFEFEIEGRWAHGLRTRLSYTYADARNDATGKVLDNSPRHMGKGNVVVPLCNEKLFAGLELQVMSSRNTVQGNQTGGFWLANFTLFSRQIAKNLEASASVYNLFNTHYSDPVSPDFREDTIQQNGRNFRVKLTYKF